MVILNGGDPELAMYIKRKVMMDGFVEGRLVKKEGRLVIDTGTALYYISDRHSIEIMDKR